MNSHQQADVKPLPGKQGLSALMVTWGDECRNHKRPWFILVFLSCHCCLVMEYPSDRFGSAAPAVFPASGALQPTPKRAQWKKETLMLSKQCSPVEKPLA